MSEAEGKVPHWNDTLKNHQEGYPVALKYRSSQLQTQTARYQTRLLATGVPTGDSSTLWGTSPGKNSQTSFGEVAVLKLANILPDFIDTVQGSHVDAAKACLLLDSPGIIADSPQSTPSGSPKSPPHILPSSPQSPIPLPWLSSEPLSPKPLLSRPPHPSSSGHVLSSTTSTTTSTLAFEGEWDKLITPCLCWAGVEVLYHDCFWLVDTEKETPQAIFGASNLINLCVRIVKDLQLVKQVLCEPHLRLSVEGPSTTKSDQPGATLTAARKVSQALDSIVVVCQIRASMISWLNRYFNHNLTQENLDEVEKLLEEVGEDGSLKLWKARLREELTLWQYVSQAMAALESCR